MPDNIVVATYCSESYQPLADYTLPTVKRYCALNNYHLYSEKYEGDPKRVGWERINRVFALLHHYDTVMWIDADAMVMDPTQKIENLPGNFVIAADFNGPNTGVFIARRHQLTMSLLYTVCGAYGYHQFGKHLWGEQAAIMKLLQLPPYRDFVTYVDQSRLNAYPISDLGWPSYLPGQYKPGDFIIHFIGGEFEERLQFAQKYAALAEQYKPPVAGRIVESVVGTMGPTPVSALTTVPA